MNRKDPLWRRGLCQAPTLDRLWRRSQQTLGALRDALSRKPPHASVQTVAVAGSLSRMEAGEASDCDLIVVTNDPPPGQAAFESVWDAVSFLRLRRPKKDGIFGESICEEALVARKTIGVIDEPMAPFGVRMELLLEARPVYGDDHFAHLLGKIVDRSACASHFCDPQDVWSYLTSDLIRYYRSMCISREYDTPGEMGKRRLRQLKLGSSRLIMYAGLLSLLGRSRQEAAPACWLCRHLTMTPLERLVFACSSAAAENLSRVVQLYEEILSHTTDKGFRERLQLTDDSQADKRRSNAAFARAHELTQELRREVASLLVDQQSQLDPKWWWRLLV